MLWAEMGGQMGGELDASKWEKFMVQFIRRQAERDANMFVIVPSTPAQYFHALRRQANLPYKRPLICMVRQIRPCGCDFVLTTFCGDGWVGHLHLLHGQYELQSIEAAQWAYAFSI